MGFFDSMKKGFDNETNRINDSREHSSYKTVKERDNDHYDNLCGQSDGALLNKMKSTSTSEDDKKIIISILERRGYVQVKKKKSGGEMLSAFDRKS